MNTNLRTQSPYQLLIRLEKLRKERVAECYRKVPALTESQFRNLRQEIAAIEAELDWRNS